MPKTKERSALSETVRQLRERRGLTQEQFSELVGETHSWAGKVENDRRRLYLDEIEKIAGALGVTELQFYAHWWALRDEGSR